MSQKSNRGYQPNSQTTTCHSTYSPLYIVSPFLPFCQVSSVCPLIFLQPCCPFSFLHRLCGFRQSSFSEFHQLLKLIVTSINPIHFSTLQTGLSHLLVLSIGTFPLLNHTQTHFDEIFKKFLFIKKKRQFPFIVYLSAVFTLFTTTQIPLFLSSVFTF